MPSITGLKIPIEIWTDNNCKLSFMIEGPGPDGKDQKLESLGAYVHKLIDAKIFDIMGHVVQHERRVVDLMLQVELLKSDIDAIGKKNSAEEKQLAIPGTSAQSDKPWSKEQKRGK